MKWCVAWRKDMAALSLMFWRNGKASIICLALISHSKVWKQNMWYRSTHFFCWQGVHAETCPRVFSLLEHKRCRDIAGEDRRIERFIYPHSETETNIWYPMSRFRCPATQLSPSLCGSRTFAGSLRFVKRRRKVMYASFVNFGSEYAFC